MKVVMISNYDNKLVDDILVCGDVNATHGKAITKALNEKYTKSSSKYYYALRGDDYVLWVWADQENKATMKLISCEECGTVVNTNRIVKSPALLCRVCERAIFYDSGDLTGR